MSVAEMIHPAAGENAFVQPARKSGPLTTKARVRVAKSQ